jgi:hypothetical protein
MGAALINTIATTATASFLVVHGHSPAALEAGYIHGYTTAFTFSGIVLSVAAVAAFTLIRRARNQEQTVAAFEEEVLTEETDAVALAGSGV